MCTHMNLAVCSSIFALVVLIHIIGSSDVASQGSAQVKSQWYGPYPIPS